MVTAGPQPVYRKDYRPTPYLVDNVELDFNLGEGTTRVASKLAVKPNPSQPAGQPMELNGELLMCPAHANNDSRLGKLHPTMCLPLRAQGRETGVSQGRRPGAGGGGV